MRGGGDCPELRPVWTAEVNQQQQPPEKWNGKLSRQYSDRFHSASFLPHLWGERWSVANECECCFSGYGPVIICQERFPSGWLRNPSQPVRQARPGWGVGWEVGFTGRREMDLAGRTSAETSCPSATLPCHCLHSGEMKVGGREGQSEGWSRGGILKETSECRARGDDATVLPHLTLTLYWAASADLSLVDFYICIDFFGPVFVLLGGITRGKHWKVTVELSCESSYPKICQIQLIW